MKTCNKYIQVCLAMFMALTVGSVRMNTVYAQENGAQESVDQQEEVDEIVGMVVDAENGAPIAGVRVEALGNNR